MDLLCPLISGRCNGRVNDGYSTMSDGIFDGIFPIVHKTFLLSYFRGYWLLDFSCAQSICCIYRPPDFGGFYDIFRPILERISVNRKNVIITGDFNSNMLDNFGNGKKFKDPLQLAGFNNIIKSPTRVTENSSTVIDLICTNNPTKIISSGVIDICIADHKFIYSSFKLIKSRNPPPNIKDVKCYKGVKENPKPFQDDLKSVPWWICSIFEDVDDIAWVWENLFNDVVNFHVPTRRVKARQRSLPWMNSEIRKAMNQ